MSPGIARRKPAVVRAVPLEFDSVSTLRSARVRRYAVLAIAVVIVLLAIRFILSPIPL